MGTALWAKGVSVQGGRSPKDFPQANGVSERAGAAQVYLFVCWDTPGGYSSSSDTPPVSIQNFLG